MQDLDVPTRPERSVSDGTATEVQGVFPKRHPLRKKASSPIRLERQSASITVRAEGVQTPVRGRQE